MIIFDYLYTIFWSCWVGSGVPTTYIYAILCISHFWNDGMRYVEKGSWGT